ncbi:MAG: hypothetical protein N2578_09015 [Bdellovibrionaceae bacterium]|nr:hypothetical protein [Pseudobdellovibrionaceae bacterium]
MRFLCRSFWVLFLLTLSSSVLSQEVGRALCRHISLPLTLAVDIDNGNLELFSEEEQKVLFRLHRLLVHRDGPVYRFLHSPTSEGHSVRFVLQKNGEAYAMGLLFVSPEAAEDYRCILF